MLIVFVNFSLRDLLCSSVTLPARVGAAPDNFRAELEGLMFTLPSNIALDYPELAHLATPEGLWDEMEKIANALPPNVLRQSYGVSPGGKDHTHSTSEFLTQSNGLSESVSSSVHWRTLRETAMNACVDDDLASPEECDESK